jgi:ribosome maturation factor RimP
LPTFLLLPIGRDVDPVPDEERIAQIEEVVQPVLADHGLELVDLEWRGIRPRGILRLFVDKPGGVGIADCERASRELGDVLDASGVITEGYDLEVSSPGLDRVLRTEREYRWAVGKRVRCWLVGGRELRGRLADVTPGHLVLEIDGAQEPIDRASVGKTRLEPDVPWPRKA